MAAAMNSTSDIRFSSVWYLITLFNKVTPSRELWLYVTEISPVFIRLLIRKIPVSILLYGRPPFVRMSHKQFIVKRTQQPYTVSASTL